MSRDISQKDIVKVISSRTVDEKVAAIVQEQTSTFPSVSDISVEEGFSDPFKPPAWCNQDEYAYCWLDPNDEVRWDEARYGGYWALVTRSNHPRGRNSDFGAHGAVERRGLILAYRPKDLDRVMRDLPAKRHLEMMKSKLEGQEGPYHKMKVSVGEEASRDDGFVPFVGEEAGNPAPTAAEMIKMR